MYVRCQWVTPGLSPRGRGNLVRRGAGSITHRSIPAWAGEPAENPDVVATVRGLSPRGRGNRPRRATQSDQPGSIPAWAGEPMDGAVAADPVAVYPRVGGGTDICRSLRKVFLGLSPRGRGNRQAERCQRASYGSIPAWAGEPFLPREPSTTHKVYPRVGGGTCLSPAEHHKYKGLSPRGRGNPRGSFISHVLIRSIPAWAGEPSNATWSLCPRRVYPRVGGGTFEQENQQTIAVGLSPRGRGNPVKAAITLASARSIPAWAGEPSGCVRWQELSQVYPRVGGGTDILAGAERYAKGLSPRGRGNHRSSIGTVPWSRSIPAWAGEPRASAPPPFSSQVYPRVGGGTLRMEGRPVERGGLSPRGRGNQT